MWETDSDWRRVSRRDGFVWLRAGSRRRRLVGSPPPFRRGGSIALARFGKASIVLGIDIAATKWRGKLGAIAASIFSIRRDRLDFGARRVVERRDPCASSRFCGPER